MKHFVSTRNACKLCTPLGAALVFKGIEQAMPLLHGSQGCSTYIRRYLISHFREPVDIASSNFSEETAVFGGKKNLLTALQNVAAQYHPGLIGIATTCLSETIGEDVPGILREIPAKSLYGSPVLVHVATPSYSGSHADGFNAAIRAVVERLAGERSAWRSDRQINVFPGICSPADLRYLREIVQAFGLVCVLLPDYSDTLDGAPWQEYQPLPAGGTSVADIASMGWSLASFTLGRVGEPARSAGEFLRTRFNVGHHVLGVPIGIHETDELFKTLESLTKLPVPEKFVRERGRLVDAIIDGHKYVFEKKVLVYGEEDLVLGMAKFLSEIGIIPIICPDGLDFAGIEELAVSARPDIIIGNSKGYQIARKLKVPLIRIGFPIHDRIGGQRILHYGYRGALELYDRIVNALLGVKQESSPVGYSYL